jgi:hypothetical protein
MKYLIRLAAEEPERFDAEWERRISSWLQLIRGEAGRLRYHNGEAAPAVFDIVNEAMAVLEACGASSYERHALATHELLSHECCRQFGVHSGLQHVQTYRHLFL